MSRFEPTMQSALGRRLVYWHRLRASSWPLLILLLGLSLGAAEYQDYTGLTARLQELAAAHADLVRVTSQGTTVGQREVWLAELGTGTAEHRKRRPAILVVAGIEGNDLAGSAIAVHWMEHLTQRHATDAAVRDLLDAISVYIFPRVNPDGVERFFLRPRFERSTNLTPADDDHDGLVDEDGPEDLNGDGLITWMRVEDPEGEYILDPSDPRLLLRADKAKGEIAAWKLLVEGLDNDQDERWNEDAVGGVNINRNFPYGYVFFGASAGWHQVCEIESRALADFVVAHPNIGIAFTLGAADNLTQPPKSEPGGKRPPAAISDADAPYYRELGQVYRDALGLKKELTGRTEPGAFSDWLYFHRGRLSLAAKPWSVALQIALEEGAKRRDEDSGQSKGGDAATAEPGGGKERGADSRPPQETKTTDKPDKPPSEKRNEDERRALKWFDENAPEAFVPWREFRHPEFPNRRVEIGGWAPFSETNPPGSLLGELCERHSRFLTGLARRLPRAGFRRAEATPLGGGVFELRVQVENTGYLPTALDQGGRTREVLPTRVVLHLPHDRILAGERTRLLGSIPGSGGMEELRYIIRATGSVEIEVSSALGGVARRTVELKETL